MKFKSFGISRFRRILPQLMDVQHGKYKKLLLLMCFVVVTCIFVFKNINDDCKQFEDLKRTYYNYDISEKLNPYTVKLKISPSHLCKGKPDAYLFIMIPSASENFEKRTAIRETWKTYGANDKLQNEFGQRVVIAFLLGSCPSVNVSTRLEAESNTYSDIIQGDLEDTYRNLLTKVLMGFKWKIDHCSKAKYLAKVDDDMFVDIPNLIRFLKVEDDKQITPSDRIYGHAHLTSGVRRNGKWSVTCEEYPFSMYDKYLSGVCYIIHGGDLVSKLFELSEYFPYMYLEDAHITGTLRAVLGAKLVHNPDITLYPLESPCSFHYYNRIARTDVNVTTMHQLWSIHQNKTVCEAQSYNSRLKHILSAFLEENKRKIIERFRH